jgi:pimeloyl-ACP methyl ester carboxylesterase
MTCPTSEFEFFPRRGFAETLLLVPGWATDHRIFRPLDLEFNYLAAVSFSPRDFQESLLSALRRHRLDRVAVLGWSLGGYLALEFARAHPERVMEGALFAVGMRERYDAKVIEAIKGRLTRNKAAYLRRFYEACFSAGEREAREWFERELLESYLDQMESEALLAGLDYLASASPADAKARFIHGREDRIAPVGEMMAMKERLPGTRLVCMENAGHAAFLNPEFKKVFHALLG